MQATRYNNVIMEIRYLTLFCSLRKGTGVLKKLCLIFLSSDYSSVPENYITTQRGKNESLRHLRIDRPKSLGTSLVSFVRDNRLNKIILIRFTLWVFYLSTGKMKGMGLSGINGMRMGQKYYL